MPNFAFVAVKLAKKIPCHTKIIKRNISDENQNKAEMVEIPLNDPEPASREDIVVELESIQPQQVHIARSSPAVRVEMNGHDDKHQRHQDFELNRKLMEEQNKMKRNLLQDAISKHAEKTQAEAKKLGEIRHALDVLDSELSNDVGILRKEIETATLHFNQVEKQYTAIEKNFLKAKQDLYQVMVFQQVWLF